MRAAIDDQLTLIWDEAKTHLRTQVNEPTFRLWFDRTVPVALDDTTFVLGVANDFAREWVEKRFGVMVGEALATVLGSRVGVRVVVDDRAAALPAAGAGAEADGVAAAGDAAAATAGSESPATGARGAASGAAPKPKRGRHGARAPRHPELNPRYVFERFVVGPHNEYATAVARSVAEAPATAYNPVFIYADTGLGKTHLIQAIAHAALEQHPDLTIRYVTVERFTDDFINAVTDKGRIEGFKQTYRENDILLVDDVQFLAEKQQTQVEFFHTFNSLYEAGRQIVITSDRPPRLLEALEERLRSRFGQGVVVDVSRPDLETRIAILRKQVKWDRLKVDDPEVLAFIAGRVTTNIRELYGALTRAVSYASVRGADLDVDVAREALADILPKAYTHPITVEMVQAEVAREFGCHVNDLRGGRRTQDIAFARHIAMYLARELTEASLPQIGERFGGRDHSTVHYAVTKIERQLADGHDHQLRDLVTVVGERLRASR